MWELTAELSPSHADLCAKCDYFFKVLLSKRKDFGLLRALQIQNKHRKKEGDKYK
jgi:hypothetical protein